MASKQRKLDNIAKIHNEENGFEAVLQKYKIIEISNFLKGENMLDLGCGVGTMTYAFSKNFKRIVGLDGSKIKIRKANKINSAPNIEYVCALFDEYNTNEKFDFIISTNVLEHLDKRKSFLKKAKNMLSKKGLLAITVPNALGLHKRIGKKMGIIRNFYALTKEDISKGHKINYDINTLKDEFLKAGFQLEYVGGIMLKPLPSNQMEKLEPKIIDAFYELGHDLPEYCSSLLIVAK